MDTYRIADQYSLKGEGTMQMKLAILDNDRNYLERARDAFSIRYPEQIEFCLFTKKQEALAEPLWDLLLINTSIEISPEEIPEDCLYAYLSDMPGIDSCDGLPVVFKFQRMDLLLEQIQNTFTVVTEKALAAKHRDGKIILFCGAGGGVGTSSVAAACAVHLAENAQVAYLDLGQFGSADLYFSGEGEQGLSDLIEPLLAQDANLLELLRSVLRQDTSGVHFLAQALYPTDMLKLGTEGMLRLASELKASGDYDYVILDVDLSLDRSMHPVYAAADTIVMVGDGSMRSRAKADRALAALRLLDENSDAPLASRIHRIYDRTSAEEAAAIPQGDVPVLGVIGTYQAQSACADQKDREIVEKLASLDLFGQIL